MPALDDDQVIEIASLPDAFPLATVPIQVSWRSTVGRVSLVGPWTFVQVVALPPEIEATLSVEDSRAVFSTRTSPTAATTASVRETTPVPEVLSRAPFDVIAT